MIKWLYITICALFSLSNAFANSAWPEPEGAEWLLITTIAPTVTIGGAIYWTGYASGYAGYTIGGWITDVRYDECLETIKISPVTAFAVDNFAEMQQERFYEDKPFIDAFAELTGLSSMHIVALLAETQDDASKAKFTSAIVQEISKQIMASDRNDSEKIAAIDQLLIIDWAIENAIEDNNTDKLLAIIDCSFEGLEVEIKDSEDYLTAPEYYNFWPLKRKKTDLTLENGMVSRRLGIDNEYYRNGVLKQKTYYDDESTVNGWGRIIYIKEYWENGKPQEDRAYYIDGRTIFIKKYNEDGSLIYTRTYGEFAIRNCTNGVLGLDYNEEYCEERPKH
jgi:hypothetical protein